MLPVNVIFLLVSQLIYLMLYLICHLNWLDSQRAEFLADRLAAEASGKEAKLSLLNKMHLHSLYEFCVLKTINNRNPKPLFDEFSAQAANLPARELERLKRASLLNDSRLDTTHPPTPHRISYIQSLEKNKPRYELTDELFHQLKLELSSVKGEVERKVLDDYRGYLFG